MRKLRRNVNIGFRVTEEEQAMIRKRMEGLVIITNYSRRAYMYTAAKVLSEAASEIDGLEMICGPDYMCRSILNQLGRMLRIEGYSENDVIEIAREAVKGKKDGYSVKEIEKYILNGRMTGEW